MLVPILALFLLNQYGKKNWTNTVLAPLLHTICFQIHYSCFMVRKQNLKLLQSRISHFNSKHSFNLILWTEKGTSIFRRHTVAIWTFTFHEKSGCVQLIWKTNFKPTNRPNLSNFSSRNLYLLYIPWTTDTQPEILGRCGIQNMLWPYL